MIFTVTTYHRWLLIASLIIIIVFVRFLIIAFTRNVWHIRTCVPNIAIVSWGTIHSISQLICGLRYIIGQIPPTYNVTILEKTGHSAQTHYFVISEYLSYQNM